MLTLTALVSSVMVCTGWVQVEYATFRNVTNHLQLVRADFWFYVGHEQSSPWGSSGCT